MPISVNESKCLGCLSCAGECPCGVFADEPITKNVDGEEKQVVRIANIDDCVSCGTCMGVCPADALSLVD